MAKLSKKIDKLADEIFTISSEKGFWYIEDFNSFSIVPAKLALISDEVSEALRVHRDQYDGEELFVLNMTQEQCDEFVEELADIIIRTLDLAGGLNLKIGEVIMDKIEKNRHRPNKHNKRY
jgi:NTP pyrophosphatase (non-canonical NTP hydrolase)